MRVLDKETVTRYHVEFDEDETRMLKSIGFLPPYAEARARLWSTTDEIRETREALIVAAAREAPALAVARAKGQP